MFRTKLRNDIAALEARGNELSDKLDALTVDETGELRSLDDAGAAAVKALRSELRAAAAERAELHETLAAADGVAERRAAARESDAPAASTPAGFAAEVRSALATAGTETRALVTGVSVATNPVIAPDVVKAPHQAHRLLDMLHVEDAPSGLFSYLRQTLRTNNAATVAAGAVKPTSPFALDRVAGTTDVVAHLSEPVPVRWFDEAPLLERFLTDEMLAGLLDANSAKVIAAIIADAGVTLVAYTTSPLLTVRKSITALESASIEPAAVVVTAADWEVLDVAAAAAGVESIRPAGGRQLYGVPVVIDNGLTVGEGLVLAADAVDVHATGGVDVQFSSSFSREDADNEGVYVSGFQVNEVICRAENRIKPAVKRPFAIRRVDLAA